MGLRGRIMNKEEIIKAIQTIKDYCKGNKTCEECILIGLYDGGDMFIPCSWEVE